jgi:hypothetical protein
MKAPPAAPRSKPLPSASRTPRSRTEAAVALVRAEFERERLERDLAQLTRRARTAQAACEIATLRGRTLRNLLSEPLDAQPVRQGGRRS